MILVEAGSIRPGEYFRKKLGKNIYLKLSNTSIGHVNCDRTMTHGVCFKGNMTIVEPDTIVYRCTFKDFAKNVKDNRNWHRTIEGMRAR